MSMSYLIPGVDLLSLPCITKADVQQAIAVARPTSTIGFVIVADTAPDVVTTPELARFIWLASVSGVPTGQFYYYNGSSWTLLSLVDGAQIAAGSIPLSKLNLGAASAYQIIQVNSAGNALQYVSIPNAIQNGTIPVTKLVAGGAAQALVSLVGTNQFVNLDTLVNYFATNTLAITKLQKGGASARGLFLRTDDASTTVEWADFDPNEQIANEELSIIKLSGSSLSMISGQSFRRNASNNSWEAFTAVSTDNVPTKKAVEFVYVKGSGNAPSAPTTGVWTTYPLNGILWNDTEVIDTWTPASSTFILKPGTYDVDAFINFGQCYSKLLLHNNTGGVDLVIGNNDRPGNNGVNNSVLRGRFSIIAGQTLELQYWVTVDGGGQNLGLPMSTGKSEIYGKITFRQA